MNKIIKKAFFSSIVIMMLHSCGKSPEKITPTVSDLTESVYASGLVKSEGQHMVYATVSGVLKKRKVEAGAVVSAGTVLFEIDQEVAKWNSQNAQLGYDMSKNNRGFIQDKIAEMELKVLAAKEKMDLEQSVYNRSKAVLATEGISKLDWERVVFNLKNAQATWKTTQKQLEQLQEQFRVEEQKNNNNLQIVKKNLQDYSVRANQSGEVYDVLVEEGSLITPQIPLAIIGQNNQFLLSLEVDENDMVRVNLGQQVWVTLDSYKGEVFEARISKIYPIMNERSRTFRVEATFLKLPKKLYPNLTVESNIVIRTKKNALTIPKRFLENEQYVWISETEKIKVKTGISDYQNVEILEGLQANQYIYLPKK